jgi:hypothetical protein
MIALCRKGGAKSLQKILETADLSESVRGLGPPHSAIAFLLLLQLLDGG